MSQIILHHYALSPYSEKVRLAMGLKDISWSSVDIPIWTPRPKLTPMRRLSKDPYPPNGS
jgi:glutathione S-transferase